MKSISFKLQLLEPSEHPALRLIGLVDDVASSEITDIAREHDRVLAEAEEHAWQAQQDGAR